jgi:hypothetical protein
MKYFSPTDIRVQRKILRPHPLCCYNTTPKTGKFIQTEQKFISHNPAGWKIKDKDNVVCVW